VIQPIGSTQQIRVDVRIITATNEDLPSANGNFREDLYHRLNEFKMDVPPLREREEDLEIFTQHFIKLANQELGRQIKRLSSGAMTVFRQYDWPGNLRELKNVIRRMVLLTESETAGMESLPDEMTFSVNQMPKTQSTDLKALNEGNEKELIKEILRQVKNNKSKAARLLNIDRKTLYKKMEKYQIEG